MFNYCYNTFSGECFSQECTQKGEGRKRIKMVVFGVLLGLPEITILEIVGKISFKINI